MRVWHFTTSAAASDGVSNGVLFAVDAFRSLGFEAHALAEHIAPGLQSLFTDYRQADLAAGDLLCFHHSIGVCEDVENWLQRFPGRRWMVYHNITPETFFAAGSVHQQACALGRAQLVRWAGLFEASLADSSYNRRELQFAGYVNTSVIPLLLPSDEMASLRPDPDQLARLDGPFSILYVGRLVPNKCQHQLLVLFSQLRKQIPVPMALHLVGGAATSEYENRLRGDIESLGLEADVTLHGKVSEPVLNAFYQAADLYLSLSEHEGFGIPFLEAMRFGCPIAAFDCGAVAETVGPGGLLLREKAPSRLVPEVAGLIASPRRRLALRLAQPAHLARFTRAALVERLRTFVNLHLPGLAAMASVPGAAHAGAAAAGVEVLMEGPFDSHYSLAHVNREMARAALRAGRRVRLRNTEGGGDYPVDWRFIRERAGDLVPAFAEAATVERASWGLRNLYPPRVSGLAADITILGPFGWEESRIALRHVDHINHHAHGVLAMSSYVRKVLQDSGVTVPIEVCGLGVVTAPGTATVDSGLPTGDYLLHVSSAFPRKGLDVLFGAFDEAVPAQRPIGLVIKSFRNPHNQIEQLTGQHAWQRAASTAGPQVWRRAGDMRWLAVIEEDLDPAALASLYRGALALVAPSRGEGFGLPLAEAMQLGVPVIATESGGHADFCTTDTALLVRCRYAYARTHLNEDGDALWFEPDRDSLRDAIAQVVTAPAPADRLERARLRIAKEFGWDAVWQRAEAFASRLRRQANTPVAESPPRVALVSTWNTRCGIADYSRNLVSAFPAGQWDVFANTDAELLAADEPQVQRCWRNAGDVPDGGALDVLGGRLLDAAHPLVLIQFNFGFYSMPEFGRLLGRLKQAGKAVVVQFHSTRDVEPPHLPKSLGEIRAELALCDRLLVHTVDDMNRLRDLGLDQFAALIPFGFPAAPEPGGGESEPVLATTGFLLPHKGFHELVDAFDLVKPQWPELRLSLLTAKHPAGISAVESQRLADRIARSPHAGDIALDTRYLPEEEILGRLSSARLVVYPYRQNQESASAAVRWGIASGRPVAVTPCSQFEDIAGVSYPLSGFAPAEMARSLLALKDLPDAHPLSAAQLALARARSWPAIGRRVWQMLLAVAAR